MNRPTSLLYTIILGWILMASQAWAHVSPNVKLATTREAIAHLLPKGTLLLKDVRLDNAQLASLKASGDWPSHENHYKFFVSRDQNGNLQRAAVFITEFTRHGPIVVAVALDPNGKVVDAMLTDIQAEPLEWVGPLLRGHYLKQFVGKGSEMQLNLEPQWKNSTTKMTQAYALIIARAVKRAARLFDLVFKQNT